MSSCRATNAKAQDGGNHDGLPIVLEAFAVHGGFNGKPRTLDRVEIPERDADSESIAK